MRVLCRSIWNDDSICQNIFRLYYLEMLSKLYPYSFTMMKVIGMWPPLSTEVTVKNIISILHTCFISMWALSFTISLSIQIIICAVRTEQFMDISFLCGSAIDVCAKIIMMTSSHEYFHNLFRFFAHNKWRMVNEDERNIQEKFNSIIRLGSQFMITMTSATVTMLCLGSLFEHMPKRALFVRAWTPWSVTQDTWYFLTFTYQVIANTMSAFIAITFDLMYMTTLLQFCAQMEILKYRLYNFDKKLQQVVTSTSDRSSLEATEKDLLTKCIKHQLEIYRFVQYTNDACGPTIFIQYSMAGLVICASIYTLSMLEHFNSAFVGLFFYLSVILSELFMFCACGNEVTRQSLSIADAAYSMNWNHLSLQTQKNVMFMITRSQRLLEIKSGHVVVLSMESFGNILQLSYSIYNLLSRSK